MERAGFLCAFQGCFRNSLYLNPHVNALISYSDLVSQWFHTGCLDCTVKLSGYTRRYMDQTDDGNGLTLTELSFYVVSYWHGFN